MAAGTEYPIDIALEHRRRRTEPDRVGEDEDVDLSKRVPFGDDICRGLAIALLKLEHRVEAEAIEVPHDDFVAVLANGLGITVGYRQREAVRRRVAGDDRVLERTGPSHPQCAVNTGSGGSEKSSRVTPPNTVSIARAWP